MQDYSYSVFSLAAIVIHLIINFKLLIGRGEDTARGRSYRNFLLGTLAYYVFDGAWGGICGTWLDKGLVCRDYILLSLACRLRFFVGAFCHPLS